MEAVCATENTKVANCWQDITLESRETLELLHKKENCGELNFSQFASLQMCLGVQANSSASYFVNVCALTSFAELVTCDCCAFDNGQAQSSATTECKGTNFHPGTSDTNLS